MSLPIPIFDSRLTGAVSGDGKYRATFNVSTWVFGSPYKAGQKKAVGNKELTILDVQENRTNDTLTVTFEVKTLRTAQQASIGAGAIIIALIVLAGISTIYLSLTKVEKIIESPTGQLAVGSVFLVIVALLIGGIIFYFKKIRS